MLKRMLMRREFHQNNTILLWFYISTIVLLLPCLKAEFLNKIVIDSSEQAVYNSNTISLPSIKTDTTLSEQQTSLQITKLDVSTSHEASISYAAGHYITCLAQDNHRRIWIGSEDAGIACLDSNQLFIYQQQHKKAAQYPLAITVNSQNDVYVGTSNNGILCLTNTIWTSIGIMEGLCGTRINALLTCQDKSIWMATETGIVHCQASGKFQFHSSCNGLPKEEIVSLTEDSSGKIWIATSCGTIASYNQECWQILSCRSHQKFAAINQILAIPDDLLCLATTEGIILVNPMTCHCQHIQPTKISSSCPEDYITCISRHDNGDLFFGLRKAGVLHYSNQTKQWKHVTFAKNQLLNAYVSSILPLTDRQILIGTYGGGLCLLNYHNNNVYNLKSISSTKIPLSPLPYARNATLDTSNISSFCRKIPPKNYNSIDVLYLGEDWQTQGEWIGKYGAYAYVLAAMGLPNDYVGGEHACEFSYNPYMGRNRKHNDSLRYWTHRKKSQDPRSLQCPISKFRRQSSWDDAGENYPPEQNGPDFLIDIELPPGDFLLSLYFVNIDILDAPSYWRTYDGFPSPNRFRDYLIEVTHKTKDDTQHNEILATSRVMHFGSGVYKRFYLRGGKRFTFRIDRNKSHNTILSAIFIDHLSSLFSPIFAIQQNAGRPKESKTDDTSPIVHQTLSLQQLLLQFTEQLKSEITSATPNLITYLPQIVLPLIAQSRSVLEQSREISQIFEISVRNQGSLTICVGKESPLQWIFSSSCGMNYHGALHRPVKSAFTA